jgi:peptidoglycan/xylan/chitin deacetylase (PgdA/CDA1 family)
VDDDADPQRLVTSPAHMESHVRWLKRRGYRFVTAGELAADPTPRTQTAVLTYDDGWRDGLTTVMPALKDLGVPATFYVCPGLWGRQHENVAGDAGRLMTRDDAAALHDGGMELASHSMTHPDLRRLTEDELETEVQRSRAEIEVITGAPCTTFAYPFGLYGEREMSAVARAGYDLAFGWVPGPWRRFAAPRFAAPPRHGALRLALKTIGIRRRVVLG